MTAEKTIVKVAPKETKMTRGEIGVFDRILYNYMKKQFNLTDTQVFKMNSARCPAKVNGIAA
jgi:hypothetical protein